MAHDVFISHANRDKSVADAACAALESAAIRCWIAPRDVQPGRSFAGEITRAIQRSKVMVLIFSAHSNNSEQVLREVQLAVDAHLHILQFRIEDVTANDDLKYFLSTPHWLDAMNPPLKSHLDRLVSSIKSLLTSSTPSPAPAPIPALAGAAEPEIKAAAITSPPASSAELKKTRFRFPVALRALGLLLLVGCVVWLAVTVISHRSKQNRSATVSATAAPLSTNLPSATPSTTTPTATAAATAADANKKDSEVYVQRGESRERKSDYDGALADYERALELDPQNARAYNGRGVLKYRKGDVDGALDDYKKVLELAPQNPAAHNNLGKVHLDRGELDAALVEYDRSIAIDSKHAVSFANRGNTKLLKNDIAGASADYNRALEIDPKNSVALQSRGSSYLQTRQWWDAFVDLQKRCETDPATQDYWRLLVWVAESHLPNKAVADRDLADYMSKRERPADSDWNGQIGNFLSGKLSVDELLKSPSLKNDLRKRRCQALMFAGMKCLAHDDKDNAIVWFQNCLATNQKGMIEYRLAQSELKELGK